MVPKISVILPIYNTEAYVLGALQSLSNQTFHDFEVYCIDDGSTDGSLEIVRNFISKDSRFKLISKDNEGLSATRNLGLNLAQGQFILFMDSDDQIEPETLEICFLQMTEKKLDILFFDARSVYESKELEHKLKWYKNAYSRSKEYTDILPGEEFFNKMISSGDFFVSACMYMFSKELIQRYGILFVDGILYEDNVFTFKLLMHAHRVSHIRKQFYLRLVRNDSIVTKKIKPVNIYSYFRCFTEIYFFAKDHLSNKLTQRNTIIFMNSLTRQMISQAQKLNSPDSRSSCDLLDKYLINFWLTQLTHTPKNSKINRATQLTKKTFKSLASDGLLSTAKKIARWLYRK